jgi:four helix bundle protein
MRNYREYRVWQAAHKLTLDIYTNTRSFPEEEKYGLVSQMRRASASIGANLAEGCGRYTPAEFGRYVQIAMGSASELDYHLLLAFDLQLLAAATYESLSGQLTSVRKMLTALQLKVRGEPEA